MTGDGPGGIVIVDGIEEDLADLLADTGLDHDEFRARLAEHAALGKPILEPPILPDDIEAIPDERGRMLAWGLHAIAAAYNHASNPTVPDLPRDDVDTWVGPAVGARLEAACALLMDAYRSPDRRRGPGPRLRGRRERRGRLQLLPTLKR